MVFEQFLAVVAACKELWNLWSAPGNECFFFIWSIPGFVLILNLVLQAVEIGEFAECLFESSGFKTVGCYYNQVDMVLFENLLKRLLILLMLFLLLFLPRPHNICLSIPQNLLFGRQNVQKVFVSHQLAKLIDDGDGREVVAGIYWMHDGSHHIESFSLLDEVVAGGFGMDLVVCLL